MSISKERPLCHSALVGHQSRAPRAAGPAGKARRFFDAISKLPRHHQEKVFSLLTPFIDQHATNGSAAAK